jgi:hypothetical protein
MLYLYQCPKCGSRTEVLKKLAEIDRIEICPKHADSIKMERQLCAPAVRGDFSAYECPITGNWIEGRKAHRENLAKHGCRILEPGETAAAARFRREQDEAFDKSVEETAEKFVEQLPTRKREQLAAELEAGADAVVVRT